MTIVEWNIQPLSVPTTNFFDPLWTSDGQKYAEFRYKEIVKERYMISKHTNTSYIDTLNITPTERTYFLHFIVEDLTKKFDILDAMKAKRNNKK